MGHSGFVLQVFLDHRSLDRTDIDGDVDLGLSRDSVAFVIPSIDFVCRYLGVYLMVPPPLLKYNDPRAKLRNVNFPIFGQSCLSREPLIAI